MPEATSRERNFFMSYSTGTLAVPCPRVYCVQVSCSPTVRVGHMPGKQPYDAPRVHLRALARLQQLHEEISSGRCPSIQDLAVSTGRTSRTIKRDVKALRGDFKAPLVYDRQRKGYRYTAQGWDLTLSRTSKT